MQAHLAARVGGRQAKDVAVGPVLRIVHLAEGRTAYDERREGASVRWIQLLVRLHLDE